MKDQPWDLSQTWLVSRSDVDLKMPPNFGRKNVKCWTIFRDFRIRHGISPERNVASTKMLVSPTS